MSRRLSETDRAVIAEHYGRLTAAQLGEALGVCERTVRRALPPGARPGCGHRRLGMLDDSEVRRLRAAGWSWPRIGRALGVPATTAQSRWRRCGKGC